MLQVIWSVKGLWFGGVMCASSTAATTFHRVNQEGESFQVFLIQRIIGSKKLKKKKS